MDHGSSSPSLGIANSTSGPFAIRNQKTNGNFVHQGKRFRFGVTAVAHVLRFLPGHRTAGENPAQPLARSSPGTTSLPPTIPLEFARAIAQNGQPVTFEAMRPRRSAVGLSQTFEGKRKPPAGDTASANDTKIRLLSISTSPITYDFEQAKKPGRTGWATQSITNSLLSDLLPGFNVSLTHDLFRGQVGSDTAKFDPFLQNVSASFAVSGNTFRSIGSIFGLGGKGPRKKEEVPTSYVAQSGRRARPGSFYSNTQAPIRRSSGGVLRQFQLQPGPHSTDRGRPPPRRIARVSDSAPTSRRRPSGHYPGRPSTTSPTGRSNLRLFDSNATCTSGVRRSTSCGIRTAILRSIFPSI